MMGPHEVAIMPMSEIHCMSNYKNIIVTGLLLTLPLQSPQDLNFAPSYRVIYIDCHTIIIVLYVAPTHAVSLEILQV